MCMESRLLGSASFAVDFARFEQAWSLSDFGSFSALPHRQTDRQPSEPSDYSRLSIAATSLPHYRLAQ